MSFPPFLNAIDAYACWSKCKYNAYKCSYRRLSNENWMSGVVSADAHVNYQLNVKLMQMVT